MLQNLFNTILNISITASFVALAIILLKLLFKSKLPAPWHYYIWLLIIVRLVVPISFSSSFSIFNVNINSYEYLSSKLNKQTAKEFKNDFKLPNTNIIPEKINEKNINNDMDSSNPKETYSNVKTDNAPIYIDFFKNASIFAILWLIIALSILSYIAFSYFVFIYRINTGYKSLSKDLYVIPEDLKSKLKVKKSIPVFFSNLVKTPCIVSVLSPKILLPKKYIDSISSKELNYIFLHELIHYKKKDLLFNWIFTLVLVIHWFNPIIWLCFFLMKKDCELCCDFFAIKKLTTNERIEYGETLIRLAELSSGNIKQILSPGTASIIDKSTLKRRIKMIPKFKNLTVTTICLIVLVTFSSSLILLTDKKTIQNSYAAKVDSILDSVKDDTTTKKYNILPTPSDMSKLKVKKLKDESELKRVESTPQQTVNTKKTDLSFAFDDPYKFTVSDLVKQIDFSIKDISDDEIKSLVFFSTKSLKSYELNFMPNNFITVNNMQYCKVRNHEDLKNKQHVREYLNKTSYLDKAFSNSFINKFIDNSVLEQKDAAYICIGQLGTPPEFKTATITRKTVSAIKIEFTLNNKIPDEYTDSGTLIYENGHWVLDSYSGFF